MVSFAYFSTCYGSSTVLIHRIDLSRLQQYIYNHRIIVLLKYFNNCFDEFENLLPVCKFLILSILETPIHICIKYYHTYTHIGKCSIYNYILTFLSDLLLHRSAPRLRPNIPSSPRQRGSEPSSKRSRTASVQYRYIPVRVLLQYV